MNSWSRAPRFLWLIVVGSQSLSLWAGTALVRSPNTTLRLPSEAPLHGYALTNGFRGLSLTNPTAVATPPGETNRLFILERGGRIVVVTNLQAPTRSLFLDLSPYIAPDYLNTGEEGLLGIAFHPGYATNRYFFLAFSLFLDTVQGSGRHQRLARFQAAADNPNFAPASSEVPLITQLDRSSIHSYNDLLFGPDGYLYLAAGDEGGYNDEFNNSQRIDKNLFSGILRLDVDLRPDSLAPNPHPAITPNYAIPPDNPFIGATNFNGIAVDPGQVRTEFYAVGLRNPYRMFYDFPSGRLFCSDVGEARQEEINLVTKGSNYGWAFYEGTLSGLKEGLPPVPDEFSWVPPTVEFTHGPETFDGFAAVGGVVYRGTRLSQLVGQYLFGDYVSGHIWALQLAETGSVVVPLVTNPGLVAFGTDPRNGDVLVVDHDEGILWRLNYNSTVTGLPFPTTLAKSGAFTDVKRRTPAPGIVPYDINVPFWSDHARKTRWFSLPRLDMTCDYNPTGNWSFPAGSTWIKHFDLELTNGVPGSARPVETRFLVRTEGGTYGLTYRWTSPFTNAVLVGEEGMDEAFVIRDGGLTRTQVWHYPSRAECQMCHTKAGGLALGFNTPQLNRDYSYGRTAENQLQALSDAGYLNRPVTNLYTLRALVPARDEAWSLESRVRSYLAANCAQCHQPAGLAVGTWDAQIFTPLAAAGLVDGPLLNSLGNTSNRVVRRGSLDHSVLLRRISTLGPERMPPISSRVLNQEAIDLVARWITNDLPAYETFAEWQGRNFGVTNAANAGATLDPDRDQAPNILEYLTFTDPNSTEDVWRISMENTPNGTRLLLPQSATRGYRVEFSMNLVDWLVLNVPGNRPFFSATNRTMILTDPTAASSRFYRVQVFAP